MKLVSSAFSPQASIPREYTCDGNDTSPPLEFLDVPTDTVSLALIVNDPDVPKQLRADGNWDHWIVWNISPKIRSLSAGAAAPGVEGLNTWNRTGYGGPCPPDREHRYFFRLYALNCVLHLPAGSPKQKLLDAMRGHILAEAELIGRYRRLR